MHINNYDVRKCACTIEQKENLFATLTAYKNSGLIKIEGVKSGGLIIICQVIISIKKN